MGDDRPRGYPRGDNSKRSRRRITLWPSLNSILDLRVSQVRNGNFCPSALERGTRCEQVVNLALAERHVQGVSTRAPPLLWSPQ